MDIRETSAREETTRANPRSEALHPVDISKTDTEMNDFEDQIQVERVGKTTGSRKKFPPRAKRSLLYAPPMCGASFNSMGNQVLLQRISTLRGIIEALTDPEIVTIGVYGTQTVDIVEKVWRISKRDNLFDNVIMASVTEKPDLKRVQGELADALGFTMEEKNAAKRADILRDRIKLEQKILVILLDVSKGIDLGKVGIPIGKELTGCKILLTSTTEDVLSNLMDVQKIFMA